MCANSLELLDRVLLLVRSSGLNLTNPLIGGIVRMIGMRRTIWVVPSVLTGHGGLYTEPLGILGGFRGLP